MVSPWPTVERAIQSVAAGTGRSPAFALEGFANCWPGKPAAGAPDWYQELAADDGLNAYDLAAMLDAAASQVLG